MKAFTFLVLLVAPLASVVSAHEVNGSNITVTVKNHQVEVLQSTPFSDAKKILANLGKESVEKEGILQAMAEHWRIESDSQLCRLEKQAVRSVHHDSQLQMRYLFSCKLGAKPDIVALPWLNKAPDDHFIIMQLVIDKRAKTIIFQKQDLVIDLQSHT